MKIGIEANLYRYLFKNVYFINGTAYAGKSTMVHMLAEAHDGIECEENYHLSLRDAALPEFQPNMCYFQTMSGWQEFVTRTPEDYAAWIANGAKEAEQMELLILTRIALENPDKKIFVDTNIAIETLREIADPTHVALMLAPGEMSVSRFFDRPDAEKQFIYQKLLECPDPDAALANYRKILEKCNSPEIYRAFEASGFFVYKRGYESTLDEAYAAVAGHFGLIEQ
ncbi:MAG: hypothetical protein IKZ09_06195 [Clostridia bacterium]|nr:hypothetical protein [Clostridia bacterium]